MVARSPGQGPEVPPGTGGDQDSDESEHHGLPFPWPGGKFDLIGHHPLAHWLRHFFDDDHHPFPDDNDAPRIVFAERTGEVREGDSTELFTVGGTIRFVDTDAGDTHSVQVEFLSTTHPSGEEYGALEAFVDTPAAAAGFGATLLKTANWAFAVNDADIQHLSEGEIVLQTYRVTVIDAAGEQDSRLVTVRLEGSNDAPAVADHSFTIGAESEAGATVGLVLATDVDSTDLSYAITSGNEAGAFAIDSTTGTLFLARPASEVEAGTQIMTVEVSDGFTATTASTTVEVLPAPAPATTALVEQPLAEDAAEPAATRAEFAANPGVFDDVTDTSNFDLPAFDVGDLLDTMIENIESHDFPGAGAVIAALQDLADGLEQPDHAIGDWFDDLFAHEHADSPFDDVTDHFPRDGGEAHHGPHHVLDDFLTGLG